MAYFLDFDERALKEWRKLGSTVREQLKKKLVEVLESPRIEANKLRGMPDCYKIKLRSSGYRLVYQVIGVLRRNPRFFRHLSFSPATSASRSIISLLLWKM